MRLQRGPATSLMSDSCENTAGAPAQAPAGVKSHRDDQMIRLNLLRALQLHRRLALGCTVAGLLLALAYAIVMWPVYTAKSQIYVQPVQPRMMSPGNDQNGSINAAGYDAYIRQHRLSIVDEQLHSLMLEDSAPGAVHVSLTAMPPLHPNLGGILKGVLPLALGGLLLGLLAAIVANKLDPRVYIEADIEDALGFAPIAVLPDFDEVSDRIAAEYLLRLAAAIEHAGRNGDLQTCILTGTSRHTGVSTIAERMRDALCAMGRPAVVLNATGYAHRDSPETEASSVLLRQVASRAELDERSLVLIDTAPIVLSAETEYLARSADGALIVVESGVTTRAQLLAAADMLQRLDVGAIGFVLNRVSQATADPAFRRSLHEMEKHLRNHGASGSMWPVKWHGLVDEPPTKPEYTTQENALSAQSESAQEPAEPRPASTVYAFPKPPSELPSPPKPAPPDDIEMPWWLLPPSSSVRPEPRTAATQSCAAEPVQADYPASVPLRIQPPQLPDWFWERGTSGTGGFTHLAAEHAVTATEQRPTDAESRVARLRGLFANVGLANLHRNRGPLSPDKAQPSPETITSPGRVSPLFAEPVPAAHPVEKAAEAFVATPVAAKPEILSPKEFIPVKEQRGRSDAGSSRVGNDDEIHILPAKRGQYGSR